MVRKEKLNWVYLTNFKYTLQTELIVYFLRYTMYINTANST